MPISYQYVTAFVRKGDRRFNNNFEAINDPAVKISIIDGESSSVIATTRFPKATHISNAQGTDGVQMLMDILTKKADVAFTDLSLLQRFMQNNPNKVEQVQSPFPLQVFGTPIWIKKGESSLKSTLDVATIQLINNGTIEKILEKHEKIKGMFLRPNTSFMPILR